MSTDNGQQSTDFAVSFGQMLTTHGSQLTVSIYISKTSEKFSKNWKKKFNNCY